MKDAYGNALEIGNRVRLVRYGCGLDGLIGTVTRLDTLLYPVTADFVVDGEQTSLLLEEREVVLTGNPAADPRWHASGPMPGIVPEWDDTWDDHLVTAVASLERPEPREWR